MSILVISATEMEVREFSKWLENSEFNREVEFLITGPGAHLTCFHLLIQLCQKSYDFLWQVGIAGSFHQNQVGKVFQVEEDCFADLGAEDHEDFLDIFSLGFIDPLSKPFQEGWLKNSSIIPGIEKARGISLNTASGSLKTIQRLKEKYSPDLETMETASFFHIALMKDIPFLALRSISNLVEPRNRKSWNIPLALQSLNQSMIELLPSILNSFHERTKS